jgi:hypothetical protein
MWTEMEELMWGRKRFSGFVNQVGEEVRRKRRGRKGVGWVQ